jgi:hypothetical protein
VPNQDKSGKFRWYNDYRLPENVGARTVTVRLHGTPEDTARKLNRTENVRPIAATDPDFARLYPRRNDAESINRNLDDTLWLRRAHSIGHDRQHLNLLGYALMVNGLALHRPRRATPRGARSLKPREQRPSRSFDAPAHRIRSAKPATDHDQRANSVDRARLFAPTPSFLPGILQPPPSSGMEKTVLTRRDAVVMGTDSAFSGTRLLGSALSCPAPPASSELGARSRSLSGGRRSVSPLLSLDVRGCPLPRRFCLERSG